MHYMLIFVELLKLEKKPQGDMNCIKKNILMNEIVKASLAQVYSCCRHKSTLRWCKIQLMINMIPWLHFQ